MAGKSRAIEVLAVTYTFLLISTIATLLRIYCRAWVVKGFAADDWLAVAAQILFIVFCAYEITGVGYGTGRHIPDIEPENIPRAMHMWWACEPLYVLTGMAIKASIAIFLLRICVTKTHRIIIYVVTAVTEVYSLFFFLLFVLQCRPTALFWLRCWTDWTFSTLPVFLVWNLQMDRKVKISVIAILAAGAIASSATIIRFPYLYSLTDIDDFLYSTVDVAIWSTVETGLGITASGVATLRPLLKMFFGGGSSAPGHGSSARVWRRTGSGHRNAGYIRSGTNNGETFDLHDQPGKNIGVTTTINHGDERVKSTGHDSKVKGDGASVGSESGPDVDDWNNSQSELAVEEPHSSNGWNIMVHKTIVQTRGAEAV
ncbi:hypothetical protein B0I35DRAFT_499896 [Stachybotrys elegans]|uniref:Rhodopsin domain-containing protein n=1 Tax=Stachybotrys elegans TaxID=80388 RepID=A0A8K0SV71_9HYPO|nr:hypothetical protein B0I35DRAFT_499896 [Stachybotrys elegans]